MRESAPRATSYRGEVSGTSEVIPWTAENMAGVRYNATQAAITLPVAKDARTLPQSALH
jgi:hypothetical protein